MPVVTAKLGHRNVNVVILLVLYGSAVQFCSGSGMGFLLLPQSMRVCFVCLILVLLPGCCSSTDMDLPLKS